MEQLKSLSSPETAYLSIHPRLGGKIWVQGCGFQADLKSITTLQIKEQMEILHDSSWGVWRFAASMPAR